MLISRVILIENENVNLKKDTQEVALTQSAGLRASLSVRCNKPKNNLSIILIHNHMQNEKAKPVWILRGLLWGGFMFLVMEIATPFADGIQLQTSKVLMKLILYLVVGLAYGYTVHLVDKRKS